MKLASKENLETPSLSDNEIWTELKKGNPDVIGVLFCRFYNDLYFYGTQLVTDKTLSLTPLRMNHSQIIRSLFPKDK